MHVSLQYVGSKPEHQDALYGTGTWLPGEVRKVEAALAPFLLWHDDVWRDARTHAARKKDPITPQKKPQVIRPDERDVDPLPVNIAVMDAQGLAKYVKTTFNRELDVKQPVDKLRAEVRTLMRTQP